MRSAQPVRQHAVTSAMQRLLDATGATAESRWSEIEGRWLHYLEAGTGPVVVLIHGAGGGAANWYGVLPALSRRFRVLAPDLPGFGLSDAVAARAPLGTFVAGIVERWLESIGVDRYCVAGTSFGGLVAIRIGQRRPEHIRALALIDAAGLGRELPTIVRLTGLRLLGTLLLHPTRRGVAWMLRNLLTAGRPLDPGVEPALCNYLFRSAEGGDPTALVPAFRLFAGMRGQREILSKEELAGLDTPTLVVWGSRDAFLPPVHAEHAAATIPDASLRWIPGSGHSPNWEAPDAVADAMLEFFSGVHRAT